jgi:hypothetical protein
MLALTLVLVIAAWQATAATRDAARATRDSVENESLPYLVLDRERGIGDFTYANGARSLRNFRWPIDMVVAGNRIFVALALQNRGSGFGVVRFTILQVVASDAKEFVFPLRAGWIFERGQRNVLSTSIPLGPRRLQKFIALAREGTPLRIHVWYTNLNGTTKYSTVITAFRRTGGSTRSPRDDLWDYRSDFIVHKWI